MFLKNFKKMSSDKQSTTLKHGDGHELKIAHKGLSKKMRDDLEKLPLHFDGGGDVPKPGATPTPPTDDKPQAPVVINVGQPQGTPAPPPQVTPVPQSAQQTPAPAPQSTPVAPPTAAPQPPDQEGAAPDPTQEAPMDPSSPQQATQDTAPSNAGSPPDNNSAPPETSTQQAQRQVAAQGLTPADPDYQKKVFSQALNSEDGKFYQELASGKIQPKTYQDLFDDKKTWYGKAGMLFGMMLSGAGSGLAHQPNAMLHMMDQQISNDLEAQKATKQNAQSMLQKYQQYQNDQATHALQGAQGKKFLQDTELERQEVTKLRLYNQMTLAYVHNLDGVASKLPPGQQAAGQQALAAVKSGAMQKVSQNNATAASILADTEAKWHAKNAVGNMVVPEQAKYDSDRHLPGVGSFSQALTPETTDTIRGISNFQNLLKEATDLNDTLGRRGAWTPTEKARAAQVHNDLVSSYNDVKGLKRFTGNEENLYDKIVPDLARVNLTGSSRKILDTLNNSVQQKRDLVLQQAGYLKNDPYSQVADRARQESMQRGGGTQTQPMGGVQYKKVSGGWQKAQ